ncbi:type II toxin-antitoxin system VapC family toxin [Litoribacter ruber]|uniref:Ribonuclease VapC n=1 Tax=Litoribacter ruber TaxID=702568 RepID=A0AAP2CJD5_9BACT|nr:MULTISPECIES: type II toxin-antitoxin system VapC family toxin [Litoribacter]MBS9523650.1 type II toxin-antitoxin system VapC family toxin [Litoribacter alkaliphilus]MBT0812164.1 type II toxin-antitoxin system VapC family toxin [Litoribacter ruber]
MYLLDTNICIYFLKGRYELVDKMELVGFENLFISEITVAELKYGVEKSSNPERNKPIIDGLIARFKILPIISCLDIYAKEKVRLNKEGRTIDELDLLIGATAIGNNLTLVTNNEKHFNRLQNIRVENWTK